MTFKRILIASAIALAFFIAVAVFFLGSAARIGAGYQAKILCSETFVAGRDPADILTRDFNGISPALALTNTHVNSDRKEVRVSLFGLGASKAVYREGAGCTLLSGNELFDVAVPQTTNASTSFPTASPITGEAILRVNYGAVNAILDKAMNDDKAGHRAFVVLVDGQLVDERYAQGFLQSTHFQSWSMAKSVLSTLTGAAAARGYLFVDDPAPVVEWSETPKAAITWNDLLRMQTGLAFEEDYAAPGSDVNRMLWRSPEMGAVAAKKKQLHAPGTFWDYSSGTSNLLARALQQTLADQNIDLFQFAREAVFDQVNASSFVLEADTSGNFIGSSFVYATAQDWARLGQLYLQNGQWNGKPVLSPAWIDYVQQPAKASDGQYGAHFWLNRDGAEGRKRFVPGLPEDVYAMTGHEGQYVFIIPSKNVVIVRLGITRGAEPVAVVGPVVADLFKAIGDAQD